MPPRSQRMMLWCMIFREMLKIHAIFMLGVKDIFVFGFFLVELVEFSWRKFGSRFRVQQRQPSTKGAPEPLASKGILHDILYDILYDIVNDIVYAMHICSYSSLCQCSKFFLYVLPFIILMVEMIFCYC